MADQSSSLRIFKSACAGIFVERTGRKCMNSYDVIVGSNNDTGELELDVIIQITSKYYEEYMINPNIISINHGSREGLAIVTVTSDDGVLIEYMADLKARLNQNEIAYRKTEEIKSL